MGLKDLFVIPERLSDGQARWLRLCAAIPGVKRAYGHEASPEDTALASDADALLLDRHGTLGKEGSDGPQRR